MIILTPMTSNADRSLKISEGPNTSTATISTRVRRSATLDGGSVITHLGYSAGDRTFTIECLNMTNAERDILRNWIQTEPQLILSCREGLFIGAISAARLDRDPVRFIFLPERAAN